MYNNTNESASESTVDFFKEEVRDIEEIVFENDLRDLICLQLGFSEEVYLRLMECGMDIESLILMNEQDMKEIFPRNMLGTRIKFRSRITQWQQKIANQKIASSLRASKIVSTTPCIVSRVVASPNRISRAESPSPRYNFDPQTSPSSSLFTILQSSTKGQTILRFYEDNYKLMDDHRIALVSIIVDYYKDRSIAMSMSDIVRFTEEIGVLFPSEETRYYYSARGKGLNPMGKLYDKAINARRKIKKIVPGTTVSKTSKVIKNDLESIIPSKDELEHKEWLSQNTLPWKEVIIKWKLTFRIRRADILKGGDYLLNWPLFKNPMGFKLIEIDFKEIFPENTTNFLDQWQIFRENILPYLREKIKDPDSKELLEKLSDDISLDSKDCILLLLLHAVIKPPLLSTKLFSSDGANKRRKWKPSISDAQNATVLHCTTITEYQIKYEGIKSETFQKNKTVQPQLMVIGEDLTKLKEFYVLYDCILYKVHRFIESLDILFKLYYVMNLEFRMEAKYLYELIESYFFKIRISSNPNIISLINYLNQDKCK